MPETPILSYILKKDDDTRQILFQVTYQDTLFSWWLRYWSGRDYVYVNDRPRINFDSVYLRGHRPNYWDYEITSLDYNDLRQSPDEFLEWAHEQIHKTVQAYAKYFADPYKEFPKHEIHPNLNMDGEEICLKAQGKEQEFYPSTVLFLAEKLTGLLELIKSEEGCKEAHIVEATELQGRIQALME